MSTWLPTARNIEEKDLKALEVLGFEWIEADEKFDVRTNDGILLGFYVHPTSSKAFAAIVAKDDSAIVGRKFLYYCDTHQTAHGELAVVA